MVGFSMVLLTKKLIRFCKTFRDTWTLNLYLGGPKKLVLQKRGDNNPGPGKIRKKNCHTCFAVLPLRVLMCHT